MPSWGDLEIANVRAGTLLPPFFLGNPTPHLAPVDLLFKIYSPHLSPSSTSISHTHKKYFKNCQVKKIRTMTYNEYRWEEKLVENQ